AVVLAFSALAVFLIKKTKENK
ncbi:hypothetical protein AADX45_09935, partial [Campylobacter jejuni]